MQQLSLRFDKEEIMEANISRARHGGCYDCLLYTSDAADE